MKSFFSYYFKTRPFAYSAIYSLIASNAGSRTTATLQKSFETVALDYNKNISWLPIDLRPAMEPKSVSALLSSEASLLMKAYEWYLKGKVSYKFSESLTDLLAHTDVMDEVFSFDKLPYESFFLDFSESGSLITLDKDEYKLNGVVISKATDNRIEFGLSLSVNNPESDTLSWFTESHPVANVSFETDDNSSSIGKLIEESLRKRLLAEDNKAQANLVQSRISLAKRNMDIFKAFSPLIFNSITYLLSDTPDVVYNPTPVSIQMQLNNIHSKEKKATATLDLLRDNKLKFYQVGKSFDVPGISVKGSRQEKNRHWRKGHWRSQAHGANFSLRKIIWVKPTIIRADRSDAFIGKSVSVQ